MSVQNASKDLIRGPSAVQVAGPSVVLVADPAF